MSLSKLSFKLSFLIAMSQAEIANGESIANGIGVNSDITGGVAKDRILREDTEMIPIVNLDNATLVRIQEGVTRAKNDQEMPKAPQSSIMSGVLNPIDMNRLLLQGLTPSTEMLNSMIDVSSITNPLGFGGIEVMGDTVNIHADGGKSNTIDSRRLGEHTQTIGIVKRPAPPPPKPSAKDIDPSIRQLLSLDSSSTTEDSLSNDSNPALEPFSFLTGGFSFGSLDFSGLDLDQNRVSGLTFRRNLEEKSDIRSRIPESNIKSGIRRLEISEDMTIVILIVGVILFFVAISYYQRSLKKHETVDAKGEGITSIKGGNGTLGLLQGKGAHVGGTGLLGIAITTKDEDEEITTTKDEDASVILPGMQQRPSSNITRSQLGGKIGESFNFNRKLFDRKGALKDPDRYKDPRYSSSDQGEDTPEHTPRGFHKNKHYRGKKNQRGEYIRVDDEEKLKKEKEDAERRTKADEVAEAVTAGINASLSAEEINASLTAEEMTTSIEMNPLTRNESNFSYSGPYYQHLNSIHEHQNTKIEWLTDSDLKKFHEIASTLLENSNDGKSVSRPKVLEKAKVKKTATGDIQIEIVSTDSSFDSMQ